MSKQTYNLIWYLIPFVFKSLLPIAVLPLFTHYISVEDFGVYALVVFYGLFGAGIANFGLSSVFERNFFEYKSSNRKSLLWNIILFVFIIFIVLEVITYYLNISIAEKVFQNTSLSPYLFIGLAFQTFKSLNVYFFTYLKNYENARKHTFLSIVESSLSIGIALCLVVHYHMGLYGFLLGQTIGVFLTFLIAFCVLFFPFSYKIESALLKEQLALSLPLTPRIFFGVINTQFDRYMLGLLGTMGGVGLYDIGQKIANVSFTFMTAAQNVFAPQVYKRLFSKNPDVVSSVGQYLTPFFYICIFFSLGIALFSYELLYLLTPIEYHDAAVIITILSLLYGFYFFGKQPQLLFAKKTGLIAILSLVNVLLNIVLNIVFIHYYGYLGAAFATLIAGTLSTCISFYYGQKYTPIYWGKAVGVILFYFILSILVFLLIQLYEFQYELELLYKIIVFVTFILIGVKSGILSQKKLKSILS
jgi:O-antigen/teichoic acid export membrane protein